MFENKTIGVVVPAHNEELLIEQTLSTMPAFVDRIYVVNDCSTDRTLEIIQTLSEQDKRIKVIDHKVNLGLGQTLIDGYVAAREEAMDVTAVMAGDAQMNPADLPDVIRPITQNWAAYVKGNRLLRDDCFDKMPRHRFIGNSALTLLTKFATGYWRIIDPQCGYAAISKKALSTISIEDMIKGYGYNAHILNMLNLNNFRVCDVEVQPVYGKEKSGIKLLNYIPTVSKLLAKLFAKRMIHKYLIREFHPLILFYLFSALNLLSSIGLGFRLGYLLSGPGLYGASTPVILSLTVIMTCFSFFFAMWLDMEDNRRLIASPPANTYIISERASLTHAEPKIEYNGNSALSEVPKTLETNDTLEPAIPDVSNGAVS